MANDAGSGVSASQALDQQAPNLGIEQITSPTNLSDATRSMTLDDSKTSLDKTLHPETVTTLCGACAWTNWEDHEDPYDVGNPENLAKKAAGTGCEVCAFFCKLIEVEPRVFNNASRAGGYVKETVSVTGKSWPGEDSVCLEVDGIAVAEMAAFENFTPSKPNKSIIAPYISAGIYFRPEKINVDMVQGWLRNCDTTHDSCRHSESQNAIKILLIDVVRQCVVEGTTNSRYLALSYVSGGKVGYRTLRSNKNVIMKENSLKMIRQAGLLPKVVEDGIDFVLLLKERYIWVDSLCIVQDDVESKHNQISNMHLIYSRSYLTLVSVSGRDAEDPLPGVAPGSRTFLKLVQMVKYKDNSNVLLAANSPGLRSLLRISPYETRGWTFQERILSRRCLYFTKWEVYFHCPSGIRSELNDMRLDSSHNSPMNEKLAAQSPFKTFEHIQNMTASVATTKDDLSPLLLTYFSLVENYTLRSLRNQSDILFAFAGIEGAISEMCGNQFRFGIPTILFEFGLLWIPLIPKTYQIPFIPESPSKSQDFPSWSWSSWNGPVHYPWLVSPKHHKKDSKIESWFQSEVEWVSTVHKDQTQSVSHQSSPPESEKELIFKTKMVKASAFTYGQGQIKLNATDILDHHKKQCGVILEDLDYIKSAGLVDCDIIALSRTSFKNKGREQTAGDNEFLRPIPGEWYPPKLTIFNYEYITQSEEEWVMNVMLVKSMGDHVQRVATGFIHNHAWDGMSSEERVIRLK